MVALSLLPGAVARGGLVIDDFSDVAAAWPVNMTSPSVIPVVETGLTGVVGGARHTTLSGFVFAFEGLDDIRATLVPQFGVLDYASSVGADGDMRLAYFGGFVANFSSEDFIQIDFAGFDMGANLPMPVTVTIAQGAIAASLTRQLTSAGPQSLLFNFSDFTNIGAVDLSSINAMAFDFNPGPGGDFRISEIHAVPEPTTLVMLLLGAGAIVRRRRLPQ